MVLRSAELSKAMVLWHGTEGIFEAAGEHSGRQFESCIKFITTTNLPFEIGINSSHQPTNSSTSYYTQASTLNLPTNTTFISTYSSTEFHLQQQLYGYQHTQRVSSLFFVLHQLQSKNAQLLCLIRSYVYTIFGWVSHILDIFIYIFYLFICSFSKF